jgi:hypothetical protein
MAEGRHEPAYAPSSRPPPRRTSSRPPNYNVAKYEDVRSILKELAVQRAELPNDARLRELNAEKKVRLDYAGRALFELLQNAVDRADRAVKVLHHQGRLYFGNDGAPVSAYRGASGRGMSDLHALCSLNTSNKDASESIGNKGVGFRSVFGLTSRVRVWSTATDRGGHRHWWGLELRRPFQRDDAGHLNLGDHVASKVHDSLCSPPQEAPSFYFPRFLPGWDDTSPPDGWLEGLMTVVVLEDLLDEVPNADGTARRSLVQRGLNELRATPLLFVSKKHRAKGALQVWVQDGQDEPHVSALAVPEGWLVADRGVSEAAALTKALDMELVHPSVSIAFPPPDVQLSASDGPPDQRSLLFSYLPTEEPCGFSVRLHGDFLLDTSRRHVDLDPERALYNHALLRAAVELLYDALAHGVAGSEGPLISRQDGWRFLDPVDAHPAVRRMVFERIVGDPDRWRALCRIAFAGRTRGPLSWYEAFWSTVAHWGDEAGRDRRPNVKLQKTAKGLIEWMQQEGLPCWPLIHRHEAMKSNEGSNSHVEVEAIPLGREGARTVFVRQASDHQQVSIVIPNCIRAGSEVDVTWYCPQQWSDKARRSLRVIDLDSEQLLGAVGRILEQFILGGACGALDVDDCEALVRFGWGVAQDATLRGGAAEFPADQPDRPLKRWLGVEGSDKDSKRRAAYEALAQIPVPVASGDACANLAEGWAPAGACSLMPSDLLPVRLVDVAKVAALLGIQRTDACDYLRWLGVWPGPPLVSDDKGILLDLDLVGLRNEAGDGAMRQLRHLLGTHWHTYKPLFDHDLGAAFRDQLRNTPWFPIADGVAAKPAHIWRVEPKDPRSAPFLNLLKEDAPEEGAEADFLNALTIRLLGPTLSADKLLWQLQEMAQHPPQSLDATTRRQILRPLYRGLVDGLAQLQEGCEGQVPILWSKGNKGTLRWSDPTKPLNRDTSFRRRPAAGVAISPTSPSSPWSRSGQVTCWDVSASRRPWSPRASTSKRPPRPSSKRFDHIYPCFLQLLKPLLSGAAHSRSTRWCNGGTTCTSGGGATSGSTSVWRNMVTPTRLAKANAGTYTPSPQSAQATLRQSSTTTSKRRVRSSPLRRRTCRGPVPQLGSGSLPVRGPPRCLGGRCGRAG